MAAGLREMQENRGFSENRIDKLEFVQLSSEIIFLVLKILVHFIPDHPYKDIMLFSLPF